MAAVPAKPKTIECTVEAFAYVVAEPNDPRIGVMLDALVADKRTTGPGGLGFAGGRVSAIFHVKVKNDDAKLEQAASVATQVFDAALNDADLDSTTAGMTVVASGDPEELAA